MATPTASLPKQICLSQTPVLTRRLLDVLYREDEVVLALEYLDCNLREVIASQSEPLPIHFVKSYTHQLLQGLAYAKSKRVMHRDLKPANILVNPRQGVVKIADFGLSRMHTPPGERFTQQVPLFSPSNCSRSIYQDAWN